MNQRPTITVSVLIITMVCQVAWGLRANGETLRLSPPRDVSELGLPLAWGKAEAPLPAETETRVIQIGVPVGEAKMAATRGRGGQLVLPGFSGSTVPGKPCLPLKRVIERFEPGTEILHVRVIAGTFREVLGKVDVAPAPPALEWKADQDPRRLAMIRQGVLPRDRDLYASDDFYPGSLVDYHVGSDGKAVSLFISCYPAQYVPATQRLVLVESLTLHVDYVTEGKPQKGLGINATTARCVIITPPALETAATSLANFHAVEEGISSDTITTDTIHSSYAAAPHPPFTGYKNSTFENWDKIEGYDYDLARRIITYLRQTADHPNLEFVVLLGDGGLVPPSYYFCEDEDWGGYDNWIPTDFFYTSPDYDLVPDFQVGRLSVSTLTQAQQVVNKLAAWYPVDWSWFQNAVVVGGRPFGTRVYYGELITMDSVNREYLSGMEVVKRFETDGTFDSANVLPHFAGGNGFVYSILHGSGEAIYFANDTITDDDLMGLSASTQLPVVVSVACDNGAFDLDLCQPNNWYGGSYVMDRSFGEAVLHSNAAGVAYIGGSRSNYGAPDYTFNSGIVEIGQEPYMVGMLTYVLKSYRSGQTSLGGLMVDAINDYVAANDVLGEYNEIDRITLFAFDLLGDPALLLPAQPAGTTYTLPSVTADAPLLDDEGIPKYMDMPLDCSGLATISIGSTPSPSINIKQFYPFRELPVFNAGPVSAGTDYVYEACLCGEHMFRVETEDSREQWFYFNTQLSFQKTSQVLLIDNDWGDSTEEYYLDAMNGPCDVWERGARDPVSTSVCDLYRNGGTIVFMGRYWYPEEEVLQVLMDYLDGGGRLFINGSYLASYLDWGSELSQEFLADYLHATDIGYTWDLDVLLGNPVSWIGRGLTLSLGTGDALPQYLLGEIDPIAPAQTAFTFDPSSGSGTISSSGSAAVTYIEGSKQVVFFNFDFEGIDTPAMREEVLGRILGDLSIATAVDRAWEAYE